MTGYFSKLGMALLAAAPLLLGGCNKTEAKSNASVQPNVQPEIVKVQDSDYFFYYDRKTNAEILKLPTSPKDAYILELRCGPNGHKDEKGRVGVYCQADVDIYRPTWDTNVDVLISDANKFQQKSDNPEYFSIVASGMAQLSATNTAENEGVKRVGTNGFLPPGKYVVTGSLSYCIPDSGEDSCQSYGPADYIEIKFDVPSKGFFDFFWHKRDNPASPND